MDLERVERMEQEDDELDLLELFKYLKKRWRKMALVTVIFAVIVGLFTHFLISPKYDSTAKVFIEPKVTDSTYSANDLYANDYMTQNYVVMLEGNAIQTKVANALNVKVEEISEALNIEVIEDTQIIQVTATTTDAAFSKDIVDDIVEVFIAEMKDNYAITNITVIDKATKAKDPVSPNLMKNTAIGAMLGLFMMGGFYVLEYCLDSKIKTKEDAEKYFGLPNFGAIPYVE